MSDLLDLGGLCSSLRTNGAAGVSTWAVGGVWEPLEADRLQVYRQSLGEVPLGLLERAVRRVIRENVYHVVPLPGVVWAAVRRTLRVCFARSWGIRGM